MEKHNVFDEAASLTEFWSQRILQESNGTLLKVAKASTRRAGTATTTRTRRSCCSQVDLSSSCATVTSSLGPETSIQCRRAWSTGRSPLKRPDS